MTRGGRPALRIAVVALLALGGAFQVVRSAAEADFVDKRPELAAQAWPGHPRVKLALSMAEIGREAAAGRPPSPATVDAATGAARRAPLSVEPFLIQGAMATAVNEPKRAALLFREAKHRDPRSAAARYFLAQYYLGSGRAIDGLAEASVLTRLVPGATTALVPGLAQYARTAGAVPELKRMFAASPTLGDQVLSLLARDADNAELVMALAAQPAPGAKDALPAWQGALLNALVAREDYARAYAMWRKISGVGGPAATLFNPGFATVKAPPPFNWTLASGEFGVAEAVAPDSLQIIYYGRANAEFASQTMMLPPGDYALSMQVRRTAEGDGPGGLGWTIDCLPGGSSLLSVPIAGASGAASGVGGRFTVAANCKAQRLRLNGTAREFAESEQAVIGGLQIKRVGTGAARR